MSMQTNRVVSPYHATTQNVAPGTAAMEAPAAQPQPLSSEPQESVVLGAGRKTGLALMAGLSLFAASSMAPTTAQAGPRWSQGAVVPAHFHGGGGAFIGGLIGGAIIGGILNPPPPPVYMPPVYIPPPPVYGPPAGYQMVPTTICGPYGCTTQWIRVPVVPCTPYGCY